MYTENQMKFLLDMDTADKMCDCKEVGRLNDIVGMYGQSATIHGVSKVVVPQLYRFRRWVWLFLLLAMAIGLAVLLTLQFQRYFQYPTVTMVNAEFHDEIKFPAVTICNTNQYNRDRLPENDDFKKLLYNLSEFSELRSYLEYVDTRNRYKMVAFSNVFYLDEGAYITDKVMEAAQTLEDFFLLCVWQGRKVGCSDVMEKVVTDIGVCYRFNGNVSDLRNATDTGPLNGLRVLVDTQQNQSYFSGTSQSGIKILVNEQDEAPILENAGVFVRPGTSTAIGLRKEELIGLTRPYKAFGTSYCYDAESKDNNITLNRYKEYAYSRSTCRKECALKYIADKCHCRHFYAPGQERHCTFIEYDTCYIPTIKDEKLETILEKCDTCPTRCHTVGYIPYISSADFASSFIIEYMIRTGILQDEEYIGKNLIDLRVYFDSLTVTQTQQKPELTIQGIIADLGGLMGMFLGASLLSLTELIEFIALVCLGCHKFQQTKKVHASPTKSTENNKKVEDDKF